MASIHSMDLTKGPVLKKLLQFTIPIVLSSLLQQFYNAADTIVVGQFADTEDLAAVGSTGSVTGLLLNLFMGLGTGVNIVCSNLYGGRKKEELSRCMHTSVLLALVAGVCLSGVGFVFAEPLLRLMNSPENVIERASLYMKICFLGVPASFLYNFCAAILRAHGDTKRPMLILIVTGLINVILNLVLVISFQMGVAGVAIATITAQYLSMLAVIWILFSSKGEFRMKIRKLRFYWAEFSRILAVGLPCGLSSILTNLFNVFFQSNINTFGDTFMAATTSFNSILSFVYLIFNAFCSACVSFAGQNYGAKQYARIDKLFLCSALSASVTVAALALIITLIPRTLLGFYTDDDAVIQIAIPLLLMQSWGALSCCIGESASGCLRGMGKTAVTTTAGVLCTTATRLIWLFLIFPLHQTTVMLYACYPLSYFLNAVLHVSLYLKYRKEWLRNSE